MTATTALTAQNTVGVIDIHYTPPDFVRKLIDAVKFFFVAIEQISCFKTLHYYNLVPGEAQRL